MGAWKKLNMSVALLVLALVWMLLSGPVLDWLVGHGTIGMLDAGRVKAVLMAGGFVLLFASFIAVVGVWDKSAGAVGKILVSSAEAFFDLSWALVAAASAAGSPPVETTTAMGGCQPLLRRGRTSCWPFRRSGVRLGDPETSDIVAFLESLTGELPANFATIPTLPPASVTQQRESSKESVQ